jgi:hypothetical protein
METKEIIEVAQKYVDSTAQTMREKQIPNEAKQFIKDTFFHGSDYARVVIAYGVEQWIAEHTYDPKYWDDYGENFCHSIFATDLKDFILGKE